MKYETQKLQMYEILELMAQQECGMRVLKEQAHHCWAASICITPYWRQREWEMSYQGCQEGGRGQQDPAEEQALKQEKVMKIAKMLRATGTLPGNVARQNTRVEHSIRCKAWGDSDSPNLSQHHSN